MGGFVRLRADEVLSITGKYPKGAGGGQRVHVSWPPPDPPLLSQQCTASLAGARPARFTSVPGRATVAFKVGFHFVKAKSLRDPRIRLWRKRGLAQLIPPPAFGRRFILGVSARDRYGRNTLLRYVPRLMCHAKCVPDTDPVGGETRGNAPSGQGGSGGIPRPFEGGIGGPGGHRGEVGIPPAPLDGGATLQGKNHFTKPRKQFFLT